MDRRQFLAGTVASLPLTYTFPWGLGLAQGTGQGQAALIPRQQNPDNLEYPFHTLDRFITPNELFYVRSHFPVPKLDAGGWRLKVEGAVERPLNLTYEEIRRMPSRTLTATLECTGNSRAFLVPKAKGVPWELGAVSNAEWTGVPLAALLDRAGVKDRAVEVILEGADSGTINDDPKPAGPIHFARSLPLERARGGNILLALQMNHADLPASHGFPLRAVVPGWYGMASIKWLTRIVVAERPFNGFFQSIDYSIFARRDGLVSVVPITEMQVKAAVARPAGGEVIGADTEYRVHGAAWTADAAVAKVEVSTDGGKTWTAARLLGQAVPNAWRLWEFPWRTPARAGRHSVMARATDERGRTQPLKRDPDRRNYVVNHVLPVEVDVK